MLNGLDETNTHASLDWTGASVRPARYTDSMGLDAPRSTCHHAAAVLLVAKVVERFSSTALAGTRLE